MYGRAGIKAFGVLGMFLGVAVVPVSTAAAAQRPVVPTTIGSLLSTLNDPAATGGDSFGSTVAVSGKTAVVGAEGYGATPGAAYIYTKGASGWPSSPTVSLADPGASRFDLFGASVAVSKKTVVVSAPSDTSAQLGVVYIYVKGRSGWPTSPTVTLNDPAAIGLDEFGHSVAVSGKTVVVGSQDTNANPGVAYIYVKGRSGWPTSPTVTLNDPAATTEDEFGFSVSVSKKTALVGAYGTNHFVGATYIYTEGMSGWSTTPNATVNGPAGADAFGFSVSVSKKVAVVGAFGSNSAYIYTKGSVWSTTPTVTLNGPAGSASFGRSVAVSGKVTVIGAQNTNSQAGTAYFYSKHASGWPTSPTVTLNDPAATANDFFGCSVAVSKKTALVGAYGTSSEGAAYVYEA